MHASKQNRYILILKIATICLFLGRAWQHLFWDGPYRVLFWNQDFFEPVITTLTSMTWNEYVTSSQMNGLIDSFTRALGYFYSLMAILTFFYTGSQKIIKWLLCIACGFLVYMFFLSFVDKAFYIGMFIEHATQMSLPVLLILAYSNKVSKEKFILISKVIIALTFTGHGLFAVGFHPVPGSFVEMLVSILFVSEPTAVNMLLAAGIFDFTCSLSLFFPKIDIIALSLMAFWGIATAFARVLTNIDLDLIEMTSHQWVMETLYRLPHGLLPLAIIYLIKRLKTPSV
jgi:hypothetical protein